MSKKTTKKDQVSKKTDTSKEAVKENKKAIEKEVETNTESLKKVSSKVENLESENVTDKQENVTDKQSETKKTDKHKKEDTTSSKDAVIDSAKAEYDIDSEEDLKKDDSKKESDLEQTPEATENYSKKKSGLSVLGLLFVVVLLTQIAMLLAGVWGYQKLKKDIQEVAGGMPIGNSQVLGDPKKAKVAIVEFSDMECPFCKKYHTETFDQIKTEYIDTGKVLYVYKNYPLPFHDPLATDQALAGKCVARDLGNQKFFEFIGKIYQTTNSNKGMEREKIFDIAAELGANRDKIKQCTDAKEFQSEIEDDKTAASEFGINGTPGFYIGKISDDKVNGKVLAGALPFGMFKDRLDKEIAKSK